MSTTTKPAAAEAVGGILDAAQLLWDRSDWIDELQELGQDTYASSVIWASDAELELTSADLRQLIEAHGFTIAQLAYDIANAADAGHQVASIWHAGQALVWLGY